MPKPYNRIKRIEEELAHNTTSFLHKEASEDIGLINCTHVKLTPDLSSALLYISVYPPVKKNVAINDLLAPYLYDLKRFLVERVPMRKIPKISFVLDEGEAEAEKINKIIDSL